MIEKIGDGGMGAVYRANQRSLGREVAIKFIHPQLISSPAMVERFMSEARAASSLNHPNVVSIYDFGRTSEDGELFLVMELLSGPSLAELMEEPIPLPRVVTLVRQILAALAEAHVRGVIHRDLKPENVIVERLRNGDDRVKVIDFGIARVPNAPRLTEVGRLIGTPRYMSPEYALGRDPGIAGDLYAVGVMLFELLTGRLPFDDPDPARLLEKHVHAARPDPCQVAPARMLPPALGEVCRRAIAVDPLARFLDAEGFAEALVRSAATERWTREKQSHFPPRRAPASPSADDTQPIRVAPRRALALSGIVDERELEVALRSLASPRTRALSIEGPTGAGRSTLLLQLARSLPDARVVAVDVKPQPPGRETGYATLARVIEGLFDVVGAENVDRLVRGTNVLRAMRTIFSGGTQSLGTPGETRAAITAALSFAAARGTEQKPVVLLIDDADRMDGASLAALTDLICERSHPALTVVMTSETPPDQEVAPYVERMTLRGFSRETAIEILAEQEADPAALGRDAGPYAPLYVAQCARWWREFSCRAPSTLGELVEWRIVNLPPIERRVLQAIAVLGLASKRRVAETLVHREDIERGLPPLVDAGLVRVDGGAVSVRHAIFARVALATAPSGTIRELHARALGAASEDSLEIRAYHGSRAEPRDDAPALVNSVARLRAARGDYDGAVEVLLAAATGMSDPALRATFYRQAAAVLLEAGRVSEAADALGEALARAPDDRERARLMELLAQTWSQLGREAEAEYARLQGLSLARELGDDELVARMRKPMPRSNTGPRLRMAYRISEFPAPKRAEG